MTRKSPEVSVIIPTYNRGHLLGRAIQSVINQTYHDFEVIIIDDGSADNTKQVVKSFKDERIVYIRRDINRGAAAARNIGIKKARGEYIAFQDSDDEWLPEKLEKQIWVFNNTPPEVGVVYTGFYKLKDNKKSYIPSVEIIHKEGDIFYSILKGNFVGTPAALVKRECFETAGMFDEKFPSLEDWELFIRISKYYHFQCIDKPLVISYCQQESISADQNALVRAYELILIKHFEDIKNSRELLIRYYPRIGHLLCSNGQLKRGRGYLFKAVKIDPLNIRYIGIILISLLGQSAYDHRSILRCRRIRDMLHKI